MTPFCACPELLGVQDGLSPQDYGGLSSSAPKKEATEGRKRHLGQGTSLWVSRGGISGTFQWPWDRPCGPRLQRDPTPRPCSPKPTGQMGEK